MNSQINLVQKQILWDILESLVSKNKLFYPVCLGQRYLPPDFMMTKDFLRQVLAEEKDFIKMEGLRTINVPHFDELSVKNIFPKFQQDPAVQNPKTPDISVDMFE